jgi:NhaP-type Na+/H+ or K+/H+ antiporter
MSVTLIVSRFVWVFMTGWLPGAFSRSEAPQSARPLWTHHAVVSWAGMRGVVSLAAALALPSNFPARDVIVFLAFCAIFATLIQGTTLGWLVRKLEVIEPEKEAAEPAEALARAEIADAALEVVKEHLEPAASPGIQLQRLHSLTSTKPGLSGQLTRKKLNRLRTPNSSMRKDACGWWQLKQPERSCQSTRIKSMRRRTAHWQTNWTWRNSKSEVQ